MFRCSAPWYELNISAPDNNVSGCCYYSGPKDVWADEPRDLNWYWNSDAMRELRRVQAGGRDAGPNGCSNCFYFDQVLPEENYFDFSPDTPPDSASAAQASNWRTAKAEYAAGLERVECLPLRLYVNFGYACNLSCRMCHQVPRRGELKRQVLADTVLQWGDQLASCLEVCVIGGEPFTLPEAIKFLRKFIPDDRFAPVQLMICTNGTVLHKHWPLLMKKDRLTLRMSIDSIGEGFEKIRLGGRWQDVERNLLTAMDTKMRTHPNWIVSTTANIQKDGVPYLGQFARWHVKHGIRSFFFDFISAAGVEDTYLTDNILHNPHLVEQIPDWSDHFEDAIGTFKKAGWTAESAQLQQFADKVRQSIEQKSDYIARMRRQRGRNDWAPQVPDQGSSKWVDHLEPVAPPDKTPVPIGEFEGVAAFTMTRLGDYMATPYLALKPSPEGGQFRVRLHWPKQAKADPLIRKAHLNVEVDNHHKLDSFVEFFDFAFGTDVVATGALPSWITKIRVTLTPLGEEVTLLPRVIEIDFDPETARNPPAEPADEVDVQHGWLGKAIVGASTRLSRLRSRLLVR